jgi:hypothetical protein
MKFAALAGLGVVTLVTWNTVIGPVMGSLFRAVNHILFVLTHLAGG